jgi:Flp pilus assembly protein TadB
MPTYLRDRGWTPVEMAIWLFALATMVTIAILFITEVVGSWALIVGSGIVAVAALLRYRAETGRGRRSRDDDDE